MDDVTQQNVALVEQAAAQSMHMQAQSLAQMVAVFKLRDAAGTEGGMPLHRHTAAPARPQPRLNQAAPAEAAPAPKRFAAEAWEQF